MASKPLPSQVEEQLPAFLFPSSYFSFLLSLSLLFGLFPLSSLSPLFWPSLLPGHSKGSTVRAVSSTAGLWWSPVNPKTSHSMTPCMAISSNKLNFDQTACAYINVTSFYTSMTVFNAISATICDTGHQWVQLLPCWSLHAVSCMPVLLCLYFTASIKWLCYLIELTNPICCIFNNCWAFEAILNHRVTSHFTAHLDVVINKIAESSKVCCRRRTLLSAHISKSRARLSTHQLARSCPGTERRSSDAGRGRRGLLVDDWHRHGITTMSYWPYSWPQRRRCTVLCPHNSRFTAGSQPEGTRWRAINCLWWTAVFKLTQAQVLLTLA